MAKSIVEKITNAAFNKVLHKTLNTGMNQAMSALGLGKKAAPKKLMPHELQELLEQSDYDFSLNTFNGREYVDNAIVDDVLLTRLKSELSSAHNIRLTKTDMREAVQLACHANKFSPVQRYLSSLDWDGKDRIPTLLGLMNPICVDSEHERLCQRMLRAFLVSAVARAIEPGVKADNVLLLRGNQRIGKSSLFRELASSAWFRDSMFDIESRDGLQNLIGAWIYELSELRPMMKKHPDAVKLFLSSQVDTYRAPYQKTPNEHPRSTVFVGTTNADKFLTDSTGSSRFHVIEVGTIDIAGVAAIRDQVWAQAVSLRNQGEQHWLNAADTELSEKLNARFTVAGDA